MGEMNEIKAWQGQVGSGQVGLSFN